MYFKCLLPCCIFTLLMVHLDNDTFLILIMINLTVFPIMGHVVSFLRLASSKVMKIFLSSYYKVLLFLPFTFRTLVHLELISVFYVWYNYRSLFSIWISNWPHMIYWRGILSALQCSVTTVINQVDTCVWIYFWISICSIPVLSCANTTLS